MSLYESSGPAGPRVAPVSPITALRRHWFIAVVIIVIAALLGLLVGRAKPVTYTAQARLAVGGQDLKNFEIPGFTLAAEEVASNYARYVGLPQSQQTFRAVLGNDASKVLSVDGSPIPTSNIILIEVSATTRAIALSASTTVADTLMAEANATNTPQTASYLSQYTRLTAQVYALQTRVNSAKLVLATLTTQAQAAIDARASALAQASALAAPGSAGTTPTAVVLPNTPAMQAQQRVVNSLQTQLSVVSVQQSTLSGQYTQAVTGATSYAQLVSAQPAVITVVTRTRTLEKYALAGVVLGVLIALIVASAIEARRRRREDSRSARLGYGSVPGDAGGTPGGSTNLAGTPVGVTAASVAAPIPAELRRS